MVGQMTEMPTPARCPRPVLIAGLIWDVILEGYTHPDGVYVNVRAEDA